MKNKLRYIALTTIFFAFLVGISPIAFAARPPPPPVTKYFGTSISYNGLFKQGSLSSTYSDDGDYYTCYLFSVPKKFAGGVPIWWDVWGNIRVKFSGQQGSRLVVEYNALPQGILGGKLKIVYNDGSSKTWSGYEDDGVVKLSIIKKPVNYVELSIDSGWITPGYIQFDVVYLSP